MVRVKIPIFNRNKALVKFYFLLRANPVDWSSVAATFAPVFREEANPEEVSEPGSGFGNSCANVEALGRVLTSATFAVSVGKGVTLCTGSDFFASASTGEYSSKGKVLSERSAIGAG